MLQNKENWSDWQNCIETIISEIPASDGVYMMHSSMKILCIEGTENIKTSIIEKLSHPCVVDDTRFRYMKTSNYKKLTEQLIKDYRARHNGKLPSCMEIEK